jgi:TatD DNase family protein
LIDFHCHLDLYLDREAAVATCVKKRAYVLSVTTTPKAWRGTLALAGKHERIRTALGLHPQIAHERFREIPLFEALLPETRYVGEVGLDGSPEFRQHAAIQLSCFEQILKATKKAGGRILTIHSRGAADEVLDALERNSDAGTPVLHWFSGTKKQLTRAIDMGCWFSVGPAMLRGQKGTAILDLIPQDRVVTETDGPFAKAKGRPLEPAEVMDAVLACAAAWKITSVSAETQLTLNFRRLVSSFES